MSRIDLLVEELAPYSFEQHALQAIQSACHRLKIPSKRVLFSELNSHLSQPPPRMTLSLTPSLPSYFPRYTTHVYWERESLQRGKEKLGNPFHKVASAILTPSMPYFPIPPTRGLRYGGERPIDVALFTSAERVEDLLLRVKKVGLHLFGSHEGGLREGHFLHAALPYPHMLTVLQRSKLFLCTEETKWLYHSALAEGAFVLKEYRLETIEEELLSHLSRRLDGEVRALQEEALQNVTWEQQIERLYVGSIDCRE